MHSCWGNTGKHTSMFLSGVVLQYIEQGVNGILHYGEWTIYTTEKRQRVVFSTSLSACHSVRPSLWSRLKYQWQPVDGLLYHFVRSFMVPRWMTLTWKFWKLYEKCLLHFITSLRPSAVSSTDILINLHPLDVEVHHTLTSTVLILIKSCENNTSIHITPVHNKAVCWCLRGRHQIRGLFNLVCHSLFPSGFKNSSVSCLVVEKYYDANLSVSHF